MLIPIHFCTLPWSQGGSRTNRICSILQRERRRHKVERQRAHSDPTIQDCTVQDLTRKHSLNGPIHSRSVCIWLGRENQKQKHHGNIMQNCVNPEWGWKELWDYKSSEGSPMCRKGSRGGRPHSSSLLPCPSHPFSWSYPPSFSLPTMPIELKIQSKLPSPRKLISAEVGKDL